MAIKNLKKGDTLYAVYNFGGQLYCDHIYKCTVKRVVTKGFVTEIYLDEADKNVGKRAVGYYLGTCALNEDYFFTVTTSRLKENAKRDQGWQNYHEIINARSRLMLLIEEGV